jgi:hypothetical protein
MGVYISAAGGKVVYGHTERYFPTGQQAADYLAEWGVPADARGKTFHIKKRDVRIDVSHPLEQVFTTAGEIPDNELSRDVKDTVLAKQAGTRGPILVTSNGERVGDPPPSSAAASTTRERERDTSKKPAPDAPPPPRKASNGADTALVPLKEICRRKDVDMEPRIARQKLRKHFADNGKQRWEWPASEVDRIVSLLKGK